jgi:hypothetical protein
MGVDAKPERGLMTRTLVKTFRALWNLRAGIGKQVLGHALDELIRCRAMQAFCLQRAKMEHEDEMFWKAEAKAWAWHAARVDMRPGRRDDEAWPSDCDIWVSSPSTAVGADGWPDR